MLTTVIYAANVLVAGWISINCLFVPQKAVSNVFSGGFVYSEAFRLVGALWATIFICSALGLFFPKGMQFILFYQLVYKSLWLLLAALPAWWGNKPFPEYMAIFFIVWVLILPFAIDWGRLFMFG